MMFKCVLKEVFCKIDKYYSINNYKMCNINNNKKGVKMVNHGFNNNKKMRA